MRGCCHCKIFSCDLSFPHILYLVFITGGIILLEYINYIGFFLLFCVPFTYILNLAFLVIQIPFAVISRGAVYFVCAFRTYFYALYFAIPTAAASLNGFSPIPFLVIFSFALFVGVSGAMRSTEDSSERTYIGVSALLSVPLYIAMSLLPFLAGQTVIHRYLELCAMLFNIPVFGDILTFLLPLLSCSCCVFVVFQLSISVAFMLAQFKSH